VLTGTDWEVRVWEALLKIPMGSVATYSGIAGKVCTPAAARAIGAAVGKNPVAFVVPCHRVIGKAGALTGYHWGGAIITFKVIMPHRLLLSFRRYNL
jgi:AraC family transcriptional regulator of adaptative response/methylated-DNA-[protein]-cysteine methyltransferase